MRRRVLAVVLLAGVAAMVAGAILIWPAIWDILTGQGLPNTTPPAGRPAEWAQPVPTEGVENFYRVSATLYRGAQPTEAGMRRLAEMGVKTVVNLRGGDDGAERLGETDLQCVDIPTEAWSLKASDIALFLKVATDPARQPVFVHCRQGSDRTGAMIAAYRVVGQGWGKEAAIDEMTRGGYGFHRAWAGLVDVIRDLDVSDLRRQMASSAPTATEPATAASPGSQP